MKPDRCRAVDHGGNLDDPRVSGSVPRGSRRKVTVARNGCIGRWTRSVTLARSRGQDEAGVEATVCRRPADRDDPASAEVPPESRQINVKAAPVVDDHDRLSESDRLRSIQLASLTLPRRRPTMSRDRSSDRGARRPVLGPAGSRRHRSSSPIPVRDRRATGAGWPHHRADFLTPLGRHLRWPRRPRPGG